MERHIPQRAQHQTMAVQQRLAGVRSEDYWEYQPHQPVQTVDGPGVVAAVNDGPFPGAEEYQVTLDGGLGGGAYTSSQLRPRATSTAAVEGTAAADYPELAQILTERPDPARIQYTASSDDDPDEDDPDEDEDEDDGEDDDGEDDGGGGGDDSDGGGDAPQDDATGFEDDGLYGDTAQKTSSLGPYDPACAYPHEGPCAYADSKYTASLQTLAMPPKSGRPVEGDFTYDVGRAGFVTRLTGYINGEEAGHINHSAWGHSHDEEHEEPQAVKVHMLHTEPHARGTGVASAMMDALYHHYPHAWINHGFRTNDGSRWWNRYDEPDPRRNIHNVGPDDPSHELDEHWTRHWDVDDVVSDMDSLAETNHTEGHEGNAHRQWDHTEYSGSNDPHGYCDDCDSDRDHYCHECNDHYPHREEGKHRCCSGCDADLEHRCQHCQEHYPHSAIEDHKEECEENPEVANRVKCDGCDSDGEHKCEHCNLWVPHDDVEDHQRDHADERDATSRPFHRGFTLNLAQHDHDVVHSEHLPVSSRAHRLVGEVIGRHNMPANSWTLHPHLADGQTGYNQADHRVSHPEPGRNPAVVGNTEVKLHAHPLTQPHEQYTDTGHPSHDIVGEWAHVHFNSDHAQPFRLSGVSWRRRGDTDWTRHAFPGQGLAVSAPGTGRRPAPEEHQEAPHPGEGQMKLFTSLVTTAATDADFRFHVIAAWRDVVAKAKRIRSDGGVRVTLAEGGMVWGEIQGDHDVYEAGLQRLPGKQAVASWNCGCKWAAYHWGADDDLSRFAGRMCSHALALQYEAMSRGMFGREIGVDEEKPHWVPRKVVVRYDIDTGTNRLQRSSAARPPAEPPADGALQTVSRALAAAGEDPAAIRLAVAAAGVQQELFDTAPYKREPEEPREEWGKTFGDDENGHRWHLDEGGERVYPCHNPHCDQDGIHHDGFTARGHADVYTDWDRVHPHIGAELHRGMAVNLPAHVHGVVHDENRPTEDRAKALAEHIGEQGFGMHWTPERDQARHYAGISDSRAQDTHVVLHAHTPDKEHIETDPDTLAEQDVISMGDHDDAEVPLSSGAPVSLKGISWRGRTDKKWIRHDFQEPQQHTASVDAPFGEPSGTSYQLPKPPGATSPQRPWENPASAGPLAGADPIGWNRQLPLESFGSFDAALFEPDPDGAEALLHEEPEPALPSTDGVRIPEDDEALTPSMTAGLKKGALKDFTLAEQQELINEGEGVRAANLDRLEIAGTHYEDLEQVLAAQEDDAVWLAG